MTYQTDMTIQPGWTVHASDGEELGTVTSVDPETIHVKKGGFMGGEMDIPRSAIDEVETGRVDLAMTKRELTDYR